MAALHPTIVISGATGAVGAATAATLAGRQARLILMARPSDGLDALVERLGGGENHVSQVPVDLASMRSVRSAIRASVTHTSGYSAGESYSQARS